MIFCKENFKKNAPSNIKRSLPREHLDVLDNTHVEFHDGDRFGVIPRYYVENDRGINSFYLYPVDKDWCRKESQINLFQ